MSTLKSAVLLPLVIVLALLAAGVSFGVHWQQEGDNRQQMRRAVDGVKGSFKRMLASDTATMRAAISAIQRIDRVREAFLARDREALLALTRGLFADLKADHRITHFYVHQPDRVNFLRVHHPPRHGDRIDRQTALDAEANRRTASGLELGPLGTFTLRTVTPWLDDGRLIGYIELGEEIDHVVSGLRDLFGLELFVFVPKNRLKREGWETGMRMLDRRADWNAYPDLVLIDGAGLPPPPLDLLGPAAAPGERSRRGLALGARRINITRLPILNAADQEGAFLLIVQDVTARHQDAYNFILTVSTAVLLGGGALVLLFWLLLDRLEKRLKQTERREGRLGRILDASANEILVFDAATLRFQEANRGVLHSLGYTLDELRGRTPPDLFCDHDPERFEALARLLREGTSEKVTFETSIIRKDRTTYPVDVHLQLFDTEEPPVFVAVARDISARKRQEEAILASERRFRSISESAQDAIIMIDQEDVITFWNSAAERIFRYSEAEALGCGLHALLAPTRFHDVAARGMRQFRETGEGDIVGRTIELYGVRKGGEEFPFELSTAALIQGGGWNAIGILRDISERKEAERQLKLGANVMEHALEGIIVTDADGAIQMANPAFSKLTGYEVGEVLGKNPRLLSSGRHTASFYEEMWRALAETGSWQGEIWNRRKDGEIYPEWLSISAIRDGREEVSNYVAIFSDITRRKELEEHLENLAFYDALTAIPNRMLFSERLVQALREAKRHKQKLAVFYFDLDLFKRVNDTHGHETGDLLLQEAARRLKKLLREEDTVARLGGDEFAMVLRTIQKPEDAMLVADKVIAVLTQPFLLNTVECRIGASIGISLFPEHGEEPDTLVKRADAAMYLAKRGGRNRYRFHEPDAA